MASSGSDVETTEQQTAVSRERLQDLLWKVLAALLVIFLVYALLHFGSQLIELQGG